MKIKKGDTVVIVSGKNRTKNGKVLRVFPNPGKITVDGIMYKKHKRSQTQGKKGDVIHIPLPIHISAVKLLCPRCGKTTRVGYDVSTGDKKRMCKKCKAAID